MFSVQQNHPKFSLKQNVTIPLRRLNLSRGLTRMGGFAMDKLMGRIILGVVVFCFVSSVLCGISANTFRTDSLLQCSQAIFSFNSVNTITRTYDLTNDITSGYIALTIVSVPQFILNSASLFGDLLMLGIGLVGLVLMVRRLTNTTRYSKWMALSYSILVINTLITQSV